MGRELQKKKNKSSIPKVKRKPKSKRINVRGNPIVAANWDQSLTLSQNYRRLGLTSKLNTQTGGTERLAFAAEDSTTPLTESQDPLSVTSKLPTILTPKEVQIERDPRTGAIVRIIHPASEAQNPLDDPLNAFSDRESIHATPLSKSRGIVGELEEQALMEIKQRPRQQSRREEEWISKLVERYGDDYSRMVMDRKLNPYQQGEGDLRRRIKKWKERRRGL